MNKGIKNIIWLVFGAGLGAVGMFFIMKNKIRYDIAKDALEMGFITEDEFVNLTGEYYNTYSEEEAAASYDNRAEGPDQSEKVLVLNKDRYKRLVRNYNVQKPDKIDPAELEHPTDDENEDDDYNESVGNSINSHVTSDEDPYEISLEQFTEEMDHFDKVTIYYYADDDTLADEKEEIITERDILIGEETLLYMDEEFKDGGVIYVRNERMSIDYEIICLNKSYAETVIGQRKTTGKNKNKNKNKAIKKDDVNES